MEKLYKVRISRVPYDISRMDDARDCYWVVAASAQDALNKAVNERNKLPRGYEDGFWAVDLISEKVVTF